MKEINLNQCVQFKGKGGETVTVMPGRRELPDDIADHAVKRGAGEVVAKAATKPKPDK